MKVRYGFVSNSSSSAFVISLDDLTMYQLHELSKYFTLQVSFSEAKVVLPGGTGVARDILNSLEIPPDSIKWTNVE